MKGGWFLRQGNRLHDQRRSALRAVVPAWYGTSEGECQRLHWISLREYASLMRRAQDGNSKGGRCSDGLYPPAQADAIDEVSG